MPSKNMLPKGKRRKSVRADYRAARDAARDAVAGELAAAEAQLYGEIVPTPAAAPVRNTAVPDRPARGYQKSGRRQQRPTKAPEPAVPPVDEDDDDLLLPTGPAAQPGQRRAWQVEPEAAGMRLDAYLAHAMPQISRARAQLLIEHGQVRVNSIVAKAKQKLHGSEHVDVEGDPQPAPLRATPEDIPLAVVYEDRHLAVIDKPAGMTVHAGSGASDDVRSRGTLVNALLFHFKDELSDLGGPMRPGIVHRLDKLTSGLIMVAKTDAAHRALAEMFAERSLEKRYIALVHRHLRNDGGLVDLPIARDRVRRTRMTTRVGNSYLTTASHGTPALRHPEEPEERVRRGPNEARAARTHYTVLERLTTPAGEFTLLDLRIETGRTHQIRVHMQALGHPVVGDTLYGAPAKLPGFTSSLGRNFLHAAHLRLQHPVTGKPLDLNAPLPADLAGLLDQLRQLAAGSV
jgi:23S rRNA pseudouridine1911/1915/1917 synthase